MQQKPKILHLHVRRIYFNQIKEGSKKLEYRRRNKFWSKILYQFYDEVWIYDGYPPAGEKDRILKFNYKGYAEHTIQHEHFGPEPVEVFAIILEDKI